LDFTKERVASVLACGFTKTNAELRSSDEEASATSQDTRSDPFFALEELEHEFLFIMAKAKPEVSAKIRRSVALSVIVFSKLQQWRFEKILGLDIYSWDGGRDGSRLARGQISCLPVLRNVCT